MSREKKAQIIERLQDEIANCSIGILTDYRGLTTLEITALRRRLQAIGSKYQVIKNTLARFAAERADRNDLVDSFEGPVAIAFGYESLSEPAKVIEEYIRSSGASVSIKGGFLADRILTLQRMLQPFLLYHPERYYSPRSWEVCKVPSGLWWVVWQAL